MEADGQVNQQQGDQGAQQQSDASQTPGWIAGLPDDLKTNETFTGFKTVGDFAKHHIETAGKVSELEGKLGSAIIKPGEGATDEEQAAYRTALGIPESPDKYELERPKMPDNVPYNEPLEAWFRNSAHKAGISADAAKALYKDYCGFSAEFLKNVEAERQTTLETGMKTLKETWANKYDENVAIVKKVQEKVGASNEPMKNWLTQHNAENDPVLIQFLYDLAPGYLDDNSPSGRPPGATQKGKEGMNYKVPNPPPQT